MPHTVGSVPTIRFVVLLAGLPLAGQDTHFHHLHLNTTDPAAAVGFYPAKFDAQKLALNGLPAVFAQKSWLLFNKVAQPPPSSILSAIWHMGWGAEDMKKEYARQLEIGTKFDTPITELFPNFFYAYVEGPDKVLIELNSARHHNFGHLHLISSDAVSAGEWYVKHFGARYLSGRPPTREPRFIRQFQVGPSASLMMDNVNIIIFPWEYARQVWPEWKERKEFESSRGRVIDHVSFSVDNLDATLTRLREAGVRIVSPPATDKDFGFRAAFLEGPDRIAIELVEGHTHAAWGTTHAGQPLAEFVHGEECLFCHRNDIGPKWQRNSHNVTTQQKEGTQEFLVGARHNARPLRKTGYNRLAIYDASAKTWNHAGFA